MLDGSLGDVNLPSGPLNRPRIRLAVAPNCGRMYMLVVRYVHRIYTLGHAHVETGRAGNHEGEPVPIAAKPEQIFRQARGRRIVQVTGWSDEDEKYVVDKRYFDDLLKKFHATVETLEITADPKLFAQILRAAETIDQDMRLGKLHSFEEAFGDE